MLAGYEMVTQRFAPKTDDKAANADQNSSCSVDMISNAVIHLDKFSTSSSQSDWVVCREYCLFPGLVNCKKVIAKGNSHWLQKASAISFANDANNRSCKQTSPEHYRLPKWSL